MMRNEKENPWYINRHLLWHILRIPLLSIIFSTPKLLFLELSLQYIENHTMTPLHKWGICFHHCAGSPQETRTQSRTAGEEASAALLWQGTWDHLAHSSLWSFPSNSHAPWSYGMPFIPAATLFGVIILFLWLLHWQNWITWKGKFISILT